MPTLPVKKFHAWDRVILIDASGVNGPTVGTLGTVQHPAYLSTSFVLIRFDGVSYDQIVSEDEIDMWLYEKAD